MKSKTKSKNNKSHAWKYFDDCLICKEMEKADKQGRNLTEKELRDAFKLVNEHQQKKGN